MYIIKLSTAYLLSKLLPAPSEPLGKKKKCMNAMKCKATDRQSKEQDSKLPLQYSYS